jgi:hypothetical protein
MSGIPDIGLIEKATGLVFRPMLHITHRGERKVEVVSIRYPGGTSRHGNSKYIRAWVFNQIGFKARRCRVFVERIWHNDRLIDDERSPLHWADLDGVYELSDMPRGYRYGHYIDICAADSVDPRLQIISQKGLKGYHRFETGGIYRLELSAEAINPYYAGHLLISLRHDAVNWENLHVVSTKEGHPFLPWGRLFRK